MSFYVFLKHVQPYCEKAAFKWQFKEISLQKTQYQGDRDYASLTPNV